MTWDSGNKFGSTISGIESGLTTLSSNCSRFEEDLRENPQILADFQQKIAKTLNDIPLPPQYTDPELKGLAEGAFSQGFERGFGTKKLQFMLLNSAAVVSTLLFPNVYLATETAAAKAIRLALQRVRSIPIYVPAMTNGAGFFLRLPKAPPTNTNGPALPVVKPPPISTPPPPPPPFGDLSRAAQFGILGKTQMAKALVGTGLQRHHLLEQRVIYKMKHIHRITFWATHAQLAELLELGMKLDCFQESYDETQRHTLFLIPEDHPHWPLIQARMRTWKNHGHLILTEFTPRELNTARWLHATAWDNGYALPSEDKKFFEVTFERGHGCSRCGFGKVQNAPFRIKGEPKWGRRGIMSLIWAYDEFFVPPAVWETIFKPFRITCRPVANRHGKLLQTVVQIVIEEDVDLATEVLPIREKCVDCGQPKYKYPERGPYPALAQEPSGPIARTRQTFHDGWHTRDIIVSQELRRAMLAHQLRGANFTPVESHLEAIEA